MFVFRTRAEEGKRWETYSVYNDGGEDGTGYRRTVGRIFGRADHGVLVALNGVSSGFVLLLRIG